MAAARGWLRAHRETARAAACLALLLAALIAGQGAHRFLTPPYENDFPGFARRAASWSSALALDGYYPFGYPALLYGMARFTGDAFQAAKVVAIASAWLLALTAGLLSAAWLGRRWAAAGVAWVGLNCYFAESALFLGTDMPWAALQSLALLGAVLAIRQRHWPHALWAGAALGLAYLFRYTALVMLPAWWLYLLLARPFGPAWRPNLRAAAALTIGFFVLAAPQLAISLRETGAPFYTLQAKNVWFGIYGEGDWQSHWSDVRGDISLWQVLATSPRRFLAHWAAEFARWWGYAAVLALGLSRLALRALGPAGRALLGGGAALLAAGALLAAARRRANWRGLRWERAAVFVALYAAIYGLSVALVFVQPRFYLALLPFLAVGLLAAWRWLGRGGVRGTLVLGVAFLVFAAINSALTWHLAVTRLQPPVDRVAAALGALGAGPEAVVLASFEMPYRYHTAYNVQPLPKAADGGGLRESLRESGAAFLLLEADYGPRYWPQLAPLVYGEQAPGYLRLVWRQAEPGVALYQVIWEKGND
ncbi:MAG: glycosyltransferase family 39 protein [Chloroflexi bacterium]|nr:glycosyltransferase family 39 protein [Chloroflexota bacterium]